MGINQLSDFTPVSTATNYLGFDNTGKVVKVNSPIIASLQSAYNNGRSILTNSQSNPVSITTPNIIDATNTSNKALEIKSSDNQNLGLSINTQSNESRIPETSIKFSNNLTGDVAKTQIIPIPLTIPSSRV